MPAHDPNKMPTDAAIVKAFGKFEEAYVVYEALVNNHKLISALEDPLPQYNLNALRHAHTIYKLEALAAAERLEAKKAEKEARAQA